MGGMLWKGGYGRALLLPLVLHTAYDYPILLAHHSLFDKDILYIYLLMLLYLVHAI